MSSRDTGTSRCRLAIEVLDALGLAFGDPVLIVLRAPPEPAEGDGIGGGSASPWRLPSVAEGDSALSVRAFMCTTAPLHVVPPTEDEPPMLASVSATVDGIVELGSALAAAVAAELHSTVGMDEPSDGAGAMVPAPSDGLAAKDTTSGAGRGLQPAATAAASAAAPRRSTARSAAAAWCLSLNFVPAAAASVEVVLRRAAAAGDAGSSIGVAAAAAALTSSDRTPPSERAFVQSLMRGLTVCEGCLVSLPPRFKGAYLEVTGTSPAGAVVYVAPRTMVTAELDPYARPVTGAPRAGDATAVPLASPTAHAASPVMPSPPASTGGGKGTPFSFASSEYLSPAPPLPSPTRSTGAGAGAVASASPPSTSTTTSATDAADDRDLRRELAQGPITGMRPAAELGLGGLDEQLGILREMLLLPAQRPHMLRALSLEPPKGVLLHGPSGAGKSLLARAACADAAEVLPVRLFVVEGARILSDVIGEPEQRLREVFAGAREFARRATREAAEAAAALAKYSGGGGGGGGVRGAGVSVVLVEGLDVLCPRRSECGPAEARIVAQMLTLLDGVEVGSAATTDGRVVVIGTTSRPDDIDPALRRPGRLDREVRLEPPGPSARAAILRVHTQRLPLSAQAAAALDELASAAVGYTGSDLASVCREAAMTAMERVGRGGGGGGDGGGDGGAAGGPEEGGIGGGDSDDGGGADGFKAASGSPVAASAVAASEDTSGVTLADMRRAFALVAPSALRGITVTPPKTLWSDIGGLDEVKRRMRQAVEWPLLYADSFTRLGLQAPRGVLLYGPPGCSKTTLVRAAATAARATFFSMSGADVFSPYVGEAERTLRVLFRRAREAAPAVIFLDEVDAMVARRDLDGTGSGGGGAGSEASGVLSTLLNEMDGVESAAGVLVVGATNRPHMLDAALMRPGRFETRLLVPLPDLRARRVILDIHTRRTPLHDEVSLDDVAARTEGFTGAELESVCRESAMHALREDLRAQVVRARHVEAVLAGMTPGVSREAMAEYDAFASARR